MHMSSRVITTYADVDHGSDRNRFFCCYAVVHFYIILMHVCATREYKL